MSNQWQNGVFGCFNNIGLCVITFFVPCYTFGKNTEALGEDCVMCGALARVCPELAWGAGLVLRTRLREKRDIEGSLTMDLLLTALCGYCTLCQEAQEISVMQGGGMAAEPQKMDRA